MIKSGVARIFINGLHRSYELELVVLSPSSNTNYGLMPKNGTLLFFLVMGVIRNWITQGISSNGI